MYSADIAQAKYDYNLSGKGPELKISNHHKLKKFIETCIKEERLSPEAIVALPAFKAFNVGMCAKTIRNHIDLECIYDIKPEDMIYNKKPKVKNPKKTICSKGIR